jgi:16S rRNA (cytosine967-C5)-methyltransferase
MNTRLIAVQTLKDVLVNGRSLTESLKSQSSLSNSDDSAFIQVLTYGVTRWYERLQYYLSVLLQHPLKPKDKDIEILLLIGLYQLSYSTKPPHACVNETVAVTRLLKKPWASSLVNGVLRNYLRQAARLNQEADLDPCTRYSLPNWLLARLQRDCGTDFDYVAAALTGQGPMTLRINSLKQTPDQFLEKLEKAGIAATVHSELDTAVTLNRPCDVTDIPNFAEGSCSVQDAAAQWCAHFLDLSPGLRLLDACCAPGGKSAACLEKEPQLGLVSAVDIDGKRQSRTHATLQRLGLNAQVITADASSPADWWSGDPYDRILIDAPCSATGVIRRHPDVKILRREADIDALNRIQSRLLDTLWYLLKPDGLLLYATCSMLGAENEEVIRGFLASCKDAEHIPLPATNGTVRRCFGLQFLPQSGGHDGFYYALLRKTGENRL